MQGGSHVMVDDPIIVISTQSELVYCLAVVKSKELNIIGQNFMTGYRIVFDREKLFLGWEKSDCYDFQVLNPSVGAASPTFSCHFCELSIPKPRRDCVLGHDVVIQRDLAPLSDTLRGR
ncbi:hypothetical protein BVRB_1g000110 [Beta vulgaris subsp. vulgaris]|nr:hypothetical protein BVRB_1g000110 [Beta vulgaris subsp. vulgaris]